MTVRLNHRSKTITIECDECCGDYATITDDFSEAIAEFKDAGGKVRQQEGEWRHLCEECAE